MKTIIYTAITVVTFCAFFNTSKAQFANKTLSNLTNPTAVNRSLLPNNSDQHDLGSLTKSWKNLYLDTAIYIDGVRFIAFRTGTGSFNTAIGKDVLHSDVSGASNTGVGYRSLYSNTDGSQNTAVGRSTLFNNASGSENVAVGYEALISNIQGGSNTAVGVNSLQNNSSGTENVAIGSRTLSSITTTSFNTAVGSEALSGNQDGHDNFAAGAFALVFNTTGVENTAAGSNALVTNDQGSYNTAFGYGAGGDLFQGQENTFLGFLTNINNHADFFENSTAIGNRALITASNQVVIGNASVTSIGGFVDWSNLSDGRVKKNVKQNVPGLSFINKLQPITYNLDLDAADKIIERPVFKDKNGKTIQPLQTGLKARKQKEQITYTGFVAQDVEYAAKELNYDFSGVDKPGNAKTLYGLRYSDFVAPLVKAVQELSVKNDSLEARISRLEAMMTANQSMGNMQSSTLHGLVLQNSPNPFSTSTTIGYSIPQQYSSAKIIITDINGSALKQVKLSDSKGSINIAAATLSSGTYQYSLYVDGKLIDSKQMIISK